MSHEPYKKITFFSVIMKKNTQIVVGSGGSREIIISRGPLAASKGGGGGPRPAKSASGWLVFQFICDIIIIRTCAKTLKFRTNNHG